jgi:hypothetical protein
MPFSSTARRLKLIETKANGNMNITNPSPYQVLNLSQDARHRQKSGKHHPKIVVEVKTFDSSGSCSSSDTD